MILKFNYQDSPIRSVTIIGSSSDSYVITIRTIGDNMICKNLEYFNKECLDGLVQHLWEQYHDEQWEQFEL